MSTQAVFDPVEVMVDAMHSALHGALQSAPKAQPPFKLKKAELLPLTMDLAKSFRDMEASSTERELDPKRIKHLKGKAEQGLLLPFHWVRATTPDGKVLRINGQHTSTMLCDLNGTFPSDLLALVEDYEILAPNGEVLLFRQLDDRKSGRSVSDVAGAYQMKHPELKGVPRPVAKLGVDGVAYFNRHVEGLFVQTGDDVYNLFNQPGLHPFLLWLGEIMSIKTPELKRPPIAGAMYATFITDAVDARKFWGDVARGGVEFADDAPASVLDAWLKSAKEGELREDLKPAQYYQGCIYTWNAFREEKQIKDVKSDTKKGMHQAK